MSKLPKHDPIGELPPEGRERHGALRAKLLKTSPKAVDRWIDQNVKSLDDAKTVLKMLALAVAALAEAERKRNNSKKTA